jgi:hypothetical protein
MMRGLALGSQIIWAWCLGVSLLLAVPIPSPASACVRTPPDSPVIYHGRIAPSPPSAMPSPREPPPEWTLHPPPFKIRQLQWLFVVARWVLQSLGLCLL